MTARDAARLAVGVLLTLSLVAFVGSKYSRTEVVTEGDGVCEANGWRPHAGPRPRVFDTFTFHMELDLLELRLNELEGVVDKFVLVEGTTTFSGRPKELTFLKHRHEPRFSRFLDRIVHVVDNSTLSTETDAKTRQAEQRSVIVRGLDMAGARPDDMVIFSDLDELPRPDTVRVLRDCEGYGWPVTVQTPEYIYDFGCRITGDGWTRLKVVQRRHLKEDCGWSVSAVCPDVLRSDQALRLGLTQVFPPPLVVSDGGWHLTWFLTMDRMLEKLAAYAHPERNTAENRRPAFFQCLVNKCEHINRVDRGHRIDDPVAARVRVPAFIERQRLAGNPNWTPFFPSREDLPLLEMSC